MFQISGVKSRRKLEAAAIPLRNDADIICAVGPNGASTAVERSSALCISRRSPGKSRIKSIKSDPYYSGRNARLDTAGPVARNGGVMNKRTSLLSPAALWRRLGLARHN